MTQVLERRSGGATTTPRRRWRAPRGRTVGQYVLVYGAGLVLAFFSLAPILWGLSTSLKREGDIYTFPPTWIPAPLTFEHYISVLHNPAILRGFANTLVIAVATTAIALVVGILGAYGFSRYRFPGRDTLLWSVLLTQLFPRVVVIVPFFVTLRNLDLMNTYQGLVLVYLMVIFPIAIWMIKGFFDRLPVEIEEAAIVDGASLWRLLWQVVVPMSRPALAAVAMYSFILAWNEFLFALVFTSGAEKRPLSVGLAFFIDENGIRWGELMAALLLMSVPAVLVFTFSQRLLVRGLSEGAVKG
jgi:multiple sugar transport system permease protein